MIKKGEMTEYKKNHNTFQTSRFSFFQGHRLVLRNSINGEGTYWNSLEEDIMYAVLARRI